MLASGEARSGGSAVFGAIANAAFCSSVQCILLLPVAAAPDGTLNPDVYIQEKICVPP
jgi:hypothetical protein